MKRLLLVLSVAVSLLGSEAAMAGAVTLIIPSPSPTTPRVAKVRFIVFSPVCIERTMMRRSSDCAECPSSTVSLLEISG
jgi:hypothetical protein